MAERWRAWLGVLGSFLLLPVVLLLAASPAHACSCAMGKTADYIEWADAVFTGRVIDVDEAEPDGEIVSSADDVTMLVAADEVFKGEIPAQVEVLTASGGASCGISPPPERDASWFWFVYLTEEGAYAANLCGGSGPMTQKSVDEVVDITGPGTTPTAAAAESGDAGRDSGEDGVPGDSAATTDSGATDTQPEQESSAVPWVVGGAALLLGAALAGVAGVVAVRRRAS